MGFAVRVRVSDKVFECRVYVYTIEVYNLFGLGFMMSGIACVYYTYICMYTNIGVQHIVVVVRALKYKGPPSIVRVQITKYNITVFYFTTT